MRRRARRSTSTATASIATGGKRLNSRRTAVPCIPLGADMAPLSDKMLAEAAVVCDEIERAHERCGQAHARVMQLEDQRQALKPDVIKRLVESGTATSAS